MKSLGIISKSFLQSAVYLATISLYKGHRGSFLGWFWLIIKPAIQVIVYTTIFPLIARSQQDNYALYLLSGILPWTFLSNSIIESSHSLINRAEVLKRSLLFKTIFPIADVIKHFMLFIISLIVMYVFISLVKWQFSYKILLLPLYIIPLVVFVISSSIIVSFMTPYIRDVGEILNIIFNILFFFTPIIYAIDIIPPKAQFWLKLNPIYWLIKPLQDLIYYNMLPSVETLTIAIIIAITAFISSYIIYKNLKTNLIYYL